MNLDDPNDIRELNLQIENYTVAEFVSVPPDFNLQSHLSMREQVGMFKIKDFDISQSIIIADSIKFSPVFSTMNNAILHPKYCFFLLQLFSDLGLIVNSIDNPFRKDMNNEQYLSFAQRWENEHHTYIRGQEAKRINFIFVNLFHLFSQNVYDEVSKNVEQIQRYQKEIDEFECNLDGEKIGP